MPDNPNRGVNNQADGYARSGQCPFCGYELEDRSEWARFPQFEVSYNETQEETEGMAICQTTRRDVMADLLRHHEENIKTMEVIDVGDTVIVTPEEFYNDQWEVVVGMEAWLAIENVPEILPSTELIDE